MSTTTLTRAPAMVARGAQDQAAISERIAVTVDAECVQIEGDAIVLYDGTDLAEDTEHGVRRGIAEAQEIDIAGRPVRVGEPRRQQHRALEHEALAVRRLSQPVEKPLQHVAGEQEIKGLAACARQIEQALAD